MARDELQVIMKYLLKCYNDSGMFEEIEFKLYQQLYNNYKERLDKLCMNSKFRIYLTTSAKKSFERMKKRGRSELETSFIRIFGKSRTIS